MAEKTTVAAMSAKVFEDLEARAQKLAATAHVGVAVTSQRVDNSHWESRLRGFHQRAIAIQDMLLLFVQRAQDAAEALAAALTCSISQNIIHRPMFAPDGQVYEETMIRQWLRKNPTSPLTHEIMRSSELMRVRVVEQALEALWLLRGQERPPVEDQVLEYDEVETEALQGNSSQEPALLVAVRARDEARALELLQHPEVEEQLNEQVCEDGPEEGAIILHYALLNRLPSVAIAIAKHPAFELARATMGRREQVTPLHIAACLGFLDVCKVLLQEHGVGLLTDKVQRSAILDLAGGDELHLRREDHPIKLAELHGHSELVNLMKDALKDFIDGWAEEPSVSAD